MAILVTGGSGFIGGHVVDKLIEKGRKVRVLDIKKPHRNDVEFVTGDICSIKDVKKAMKGVDFVYHIAAFSNVDYVKDNPLKTINFNIMGTANVLEASRQNNVKRVLFASSDYLSSGRGHLYTTAKKASEMLCKDYFTLYGLPYTILRYSTVYGPRSRGVDVVSVFVERALNSQNLVIRGDGKQKRNFIYVDDLAEGNVAALRDVAKNKTYNLVGVRPITIMEVAETVKNLTVGIEIEYKGERSDDFEGKIVTAEKAKRELGWKPKVDFEEGVQKYIGWYKETQLMKAKIKKFSKYQIYY